MNASLADRIREKALAHFQPVHAEILNESQNHAVKPGAETHFKLVLVSEKFEGRSPMERHRDTYALLAEEMRDGVHALSLKLYTPKEWEKVSAPAPSPLCPKK